jgi:hypothetical protein
MTISNANTASLRFPPLLVLACSVLLMACSVNVKKDENGNDKNVDIQTPIGNLHVSKNADVRDVDLPVYPGSHATKKNGEGDDQNANVNISTGLFGLKVVALEYQSDDPPEKLIPYYKDKLKKFGNVLECHTSGKDVTMNSGDDEKSRDLTCEHSDGKNIELKAGTRDNQHLVAVEPLGGGTKFALVLIQKHGRDTI